MIRAALIGLVRGYRLLLSPWLGGSCRFTPTCSVYSIEALERHGAATGTYLTLARIGRCHPWCAGGHDPVPEIWAPTLRCPPTGLSAPGDGPSEPKLENPRFLTHLLSHFSHKKSS